MSPSRAFKSLQRPEFIAWFATTVMLSSMPFLVNLFVQFLVGSFGFYELFRVTDVAFFTMMLGATCLLDLLRKLRTFPPSDAALWAVMLAFLVLAGAIILGIGSIEAALPSTTAPGASYRHFRLVTSGICLAGLGLFACVGFQLSGITGKVSLEANHE